MRARHASVAILMLLAPCAATHAQPPERAAVAAIDACLPRLDPELDVGFERIAARCPALGDALQASGVGASLPADWRRPQGELSAGSLRALRRLLLAPAASSPRRAAPDEDSLRALLGAAGGAVAAPGPWQRFVRWLRALVDDAAPTPQDGSAWARWLEGRSPSQRAWTLLGYGALLALLAFLGWVLRGELVAAGWLGRPAARTPGAASAAADPTAPDDLEALAVLERPAWLLRRIARRLQALGRLPDAPALTAREVLREAHVTSGEERDALRGLVEAAERVRFAPVAPPEADLAPAIGAARALLARLERRAASATGGAT